MLSRPGPKLSEVLRICRFGDALQDYPTALELQRSLAALRKDGAIPDILLMLQHRAVYTAGKRRRDDHFLQSPEALRERGFQVEIVDRGGELTFHGPGQTVAYPIVNTRKTRVSPRVLVEGLEDVMLRVLGIYGVHARGRVPNKTGVWIGERKIGAIGVRITRGISTHGMALNVSTDLQHYDNIIPCGTPGKVMTSLEKELGRQISITRVEEQLGRAFVAHFNYSHVEHVSPGDLTRKPDLLKLMRDGTHVCGELSSSM